MSEQWLRRGVQVWRKKGMKRTRRARQQGGRDVDVNFQGSKIKRERREMKGGNTTFFVMELII